MSPTQRVAVALVIVFAVILVVAVIGYEYIPVWKDRPCLFLATLYVSAAAVLAGAARGLIAVVEFVLKDRKPSAPPTVNIAVQPPPPAASTRLCQRSLCQRTIDTCLTGRTRKWSGFKCIQVCNPKLM